MMTSLYGSSAWFVESRTFEWMFSVLIFINPLALVPQIRMAITAKDLSGISVLMFAIFASIQVISMFYGIKTGSAAFFLSMAVSALESLTIIAIVLFRRHSR